MPPAPPPLSDTPQGTLASEGPPAWWPPERGQHRLRENCRLPANILPCLTELHLERLNLALQHHVLHLRTRNVGAIGRPSCAGQQREGSTTGFHKMLPPATVSRAVLTQPLGRRGRARAATHRSSCPSWLQPWGASWRPASGSQRGLGQRAQRAAEQRRLAATRTPLPQAGRKRAFGGAGWVPGRKHLLLLTHRRMAAASERREGLRKSAPARRVNSKQYSQ